MKSLASKSVHVLSVHSLRALMAAQIPAICIPEFSTQQECEQFRQALFELFTLSHSVPQVKRLGVSQYQDGLCETKESYFKEANVWRPLQAQVFEHSFNPLERLISRLHDLGFNAGIMEEPELGHYYAGNGKLRDGETPIHVDFAPQDSPDWAVGTAQTQLAWNYYIAVPTGGDLLVWDLLWQREHDRYQEPGTYYYDKAVVADIPRLTIPVRTGDVMLINSRRFHSVSKCSGRVAFGSFISCFADGKMGLWS